MKQKRDLTFLLILGLVLINLVYFFAGAVSSTITTRHWWSGLWIFIDGISIIGVLYLIRSYNRARKETKKLEQEENTVKSKFSLMKLLNKIYRFFVPKNFKDEMIKGQLIGEQMKQGLMTPKVVPTWYIGKGLRKLIDPKHKMKIGKDKAIEENKNDEPKFPKPEEKEINIQKN
jgi:glucan phosphoethanolaminetransferase (alkaline phosphatase superfamily)